MEKLQDGHIYFLNTQKLGKTGNLGKHSDNRQYTIWETLENTAKKKADRLYFIIDEAHRGMQGAAAEWLHDNLGENCPQIYLINLFGNMNDSEKEVLRKRKIALVDLETLLEGKEHNKYEEAYKRFFSKIEEAINEHGGVFNIYDTIDLQLARKM